MLNPNAAITEYASRTGKNGAGLDVCQAVELLAPILVETEKLRWSQRQTLQAQSIAAGRAFVAEPSVLRASGITAKVGDRLTLTPYGPGGVAGTGVGLAVVEVSDGSSDAPGCVELTEVLCQPAQAASAVILPA